MRAALLATLAIAGCGARTGLGVPEPPEPPRDAGMDAPQAPDAGTDAGTDARFCVPGVVVLEESRTDVVFVVDRSGSMAADFEGMRPGFGELSRWETLEIAMDEALDVFRAETRISVGAKFFPSRSMRTVDDSCAVLPNLDVPLGPGRAPGIVAEFARWNPAGGTPLGPALREALDALARVDAENAAQFIVVATDGGPTCARDAIEQAFEAIREAHEERGIDVLVIGIASTEPEIMLLDAMAIEGGRPRPIEEGRRFYDARDPALLSMLLGEITRDLARCVFAVPFPPGPEDEVEVMVRGEVVPRDEARLDGWDWTSERRAQLGLFGPACTRVIDAGGGAVSANITCR